MTFRPGFALVSAVVGAVLGADDARAVDFTTPIPLSISEVLSGRYDYRPAYVSGRVVDVFDDEADPFHVFLTLRQGDTEMLVPINHAKQDYDRLRHLIGADVTLTGHCDSTVQEDLRRQMGRRFDVNFPNRITVDRTPDDLFDAPDVQALDNHLPYEISTAGRHRAHGRVLAVWGGDKLLVANDSGRLMRIDLADPRPPAYGDCIDVIGFPETDLHRLNLVRAVWRPSARKVSLAETVQESSIRALFEDQETGFPVVKERLCGKTIRLEGLVKDPPQNGLLSISDGNHNLAVDISAIGDALTQGLKPGCRISATGSCIIDVDNWRPHAPFPKTRNVTLVSRTPSDIRVLARPPWWTVGRLLTLVGGLFAALLAILVWNIVLRRLVERRSRELLREQVAHVGANLRTKERTRLAIELHDSISQNLTGIALEIKAAQTTASGDLPTALGHLSIAERSLSSCHTELRNCLWDLRHGMLESLDMNEAIRQVLRPQIGNIGLEVRFNISRRRLSDNTAYASMKIIRELAVNAVRHGKATCIKVAGALENDRLLFSVIDNGRGFDPKSVPSPEQGHFGLLGVTERVSAFEGEVTIESTLGKGTRVAVSLMARKENNAE